MQLAEVIRKVRQSYVDFVGEDYPAADIQFNNRMLSLHPDTLNSAAEQFVTTRSDVRMSNLIRPLIIRTVYGKLYADIYGMPEGGIEFVYAIPDLVPNQFAETMDEGRMFIIAGICKDIDAHLSKTFGEAWYKGTPDKGFLPAAIRNFFFTSTKEGLAWLVKQYGEAAAANPKLNKIKFAASEKLAFNFKTYEALSGNPLSQQRPVPLAHPEAEFAQSLQEAAHLADEIVLPKKQPETQPETKSENMETDEWLTVPESELTVQPEVPQVEGAGTNEWLDFPDGDTFVIPPAPQPISAEPIPEAAVVTEASPPPVIEIPPVQPAAPQPVTEPVPQQQPAAAKAAPEAVAVPAQPETAAPVQSESVTQTAAQPAMPAQSETPPAEPAAETTVQPESLQPAPAEAPSEPVVQAVAAVESAVPEEAAVLGDTVQPESETVQPEIRQTAEAADWTDFPEGNDGFAEAAMQPETAETVVLESVSVETVQPESPQQPAEPDPAAAEWAFLAAEAETVGNTETPGAAADVWADMPDAVDPQHELLTQEQPEPAALQTEAVVQTEVQRQPENVVQQVAEPQPETPLMQAAVAAASAAPLFTVQTAEAAPAVLSSAVELAQVYGQLSVFGGDAAAVAALLSSDTALHCRAEGGSLYFHGNLPHGGTLADFVFVRILAPLFAAALPAGLQCSLSSVARASAAEYAGYGIGLIDPAAKLATGHAVWNARPADGRSFQALAEHYALRRSAF